MAETNVLEQLKQNEIQATKIAADEFDRLAERLAAGEEVESFDAGETLHLAGKTTADLEAAVEKHRRITRLQGQLDTIDAELVTAAAERDEAFPAIGRAEKALRKAEERLAAVKSEYDRAVSRCAAIAGRRNVAAKELAALTNPPPPARQEGPVHIGGSLFHAFTASGLEKTEPARHVNVGTSGGPGGGWSEPHFSYHDLGAEGKKE